MAIGFMPTDEDTDARYERLNRILLELYDVVYHLIHRNPPNEETSTPTADLQSDVGYQNARVRPSSDSSAPRLPDLLCDASPPRRRIASNRSTPASPSCSAQHNCRTFSDLYDRNLQDSPNPVDDEVFFASPAYQSPRITLAAPPRQRRRRKRSNSLKEKKSNRVKSEDVTDIGYWEDEHHNKFEDIQSTRIPAEIDQDTVDSPQSLDVEKVTDSDTSLISTLLSSSIGGSLWTAVVIVVGWKLFSNKR